MKFEREGCTFEVPDRPNVRQQLAYFSATSGLPDSQVLFRFWSGAKELITKWECEAIPDIHANVEEMTNPSQTELIIWTGLKVKAFMDQLKDIDPNS